MADDARRAEGTKIELLYFDGCPTYLEAERNLREVLEEEGVEADVSLVAVDTDDGARRLRFPGSPTLRVGGLDLFAGGATDRDAWGLGCRMYRTPEGLRGFPTPEMLRCALRSVLGSGVADPDPPPDAGGYTVPRR